MGSWQLLTTSGIQMDDTGDVWNAGCCVDMVSLGQGNIVVASESGGVWHIDGNYVAHPLSDDWEFPDVLCLALSPRFPGHIFAGGSGALYETDPTAADPLHAWQSVGLPIGVTTVFRVVVTVEPHRAVIATDTGIWWSDISSAGYNWVAALGAASGRFSGLAQSETTAPQGDPVESIVAGVKDGSSTSPGLLVGRWRGADLTFTPATLSGLAMNELPGLYTFSVASCAAVPRRVYAVAAAADGTVGRVLRSNDGGARWSPCSTVLEGTTALDITSKNFSGDRLAGGWQKTIGVHFSDPDVVAFGWQRPLLSVNGGKSWRGLGMKWLGPEKWDGAVGLHDDIHAIYFDPTYGTHRLYVLSDGGVAHTDDWSLVPATFRSTSNRELPTLQFYCPGPPREFWGTIGSATFAPLIGGGLQDNGNVCAEESAQPARWRRTTDGDGGWFACIDYAGGQILSNTMGEGVERATWAKKPQRAGAIPLENRFGKIRVDGLRGPKAEVILRPRFRIGTETLYAVGAPGRIYADDVLEPVPSGLRGRISAMIDNRWIFGLIGAAGDKPLMRWKAIGQIPTSAAEITALGIETGETVYVGTAAGEMFVLDVAAGRTQSLPTDPAAGALGAVGRIVLHGRRGPFAMMESGAGSVILRLDGLRWGPLKSTRPLPLVKLFGFDIHRRPGPITMAVAADSDVFVSPDDGDTWQLASDGLPKVPHGADIRFGSWGGQDVAFLGTWGRSVWIVPVEEAIAPGRHRLETIDTRWRSIRDPELARNRFRVSAP
jgi:hypothetical protein